MIRVRDLSVQFHDPNDLVFIKALDRLSLDIYPGEQFALIGESGSGKSTFAKSILGQIPPTPGVVRGDITFTNREGSWDLTHGCERVWRRLDTIFGDRIVAERKRGAWRQWRAATREQLDDLLGKRISLITQDAGGSMNPYLSIGSQIHDCMTLARATSRSRDIEDYMKDAALSPDLADRYPEQLSGGQRQRALIAMALASEPDLIIADEPTTGLDVLSKTRIIELFESLVDQQSGARRRHVTFLIITHDLDIVRRIATRVGVLFDGRLMEIGRVEEPGAAGKRRIPTLHPYSEMLAGSFDNLEYGYVPPDRSDISSESRVGCRYCAKCQVYAAAQRARPRDMALLRRCENHEPPLFDIHENGESRVRCWARMADRDRWDEPDSPWQEREGEA